MVAEVPLPAPYNLLMVHHPGAASQEQHISAHRILALDVGSKRIGMAVSDPLGLTAQGLETLRRTNKRADFQELGLVIQKFGVREIVVGYPLHMSGEASAQSLKIADFADELRRRFSLPVTLWDERLTSAEANRLLRETEMSIRKRGQAVDRMAATLILQSFLERRLSTAKDYKENS
jgi:putative Holliday junction resolvase